MIKAVRGDVWLVKLDPTVGTKMQKTRPAVIVSRTDYNLMADNVTVIPITTKRFLPSFHVKLANMKQNSHAVIPQIRVAGKPRLLKKIGKISSKELEDIDLKLKFYLDLF